MKRFAGLMLALSLLLAGSASAADKGTPAEAEALVKKAIIYIKANGTEKAFAEIGNPKGQFVDRDLYVFVYDMTGTCVAHGQNPKQVGKDLSDLTDPDGKAFVRERIEIARTRGGGWQDYKFSNPKTKKLEQKRAYIEKYENLIVGSGAYK